jgi:hypothetical protein
VITHPTKMRHHKIVPWILLILSIINVTLAAPVVLREIRHTPIGRVDVRENAIPASRSKKRDESPPAGQRQSSPAPPESDYYESAPHSFQTEYQSLPGSPEINSEVSSSVGSESHRTSLSSENYLASNEGGPGLSKSHSFFSDSDLPVSESESGLPPEPVAVPEPNPNPSASGRSPSVAESGSHKSFLSKWVSKSKSFLNNLASKSKNFLGKLAGKLRLWRRTPGEGHFKSAPSSLQTTRVTNFPT